ncbi:MAG TPA: hypothetical protein VGD11_16335 [Mycobacteriales bacterium]|jgi:hypothetical protein
MDEHRQVPADAEDYGYDLAHEAPMGPGAGPSRRADPQSDVATEADDQGGDYGYDLAHDVPRR